MTRWLTTIRTPEDPRLLITQISACKDGKILMKSTPYTRTLTLCFSVMQKNFGKRKSPFSSWGGVN